MRARGTRPGSSAASTEPTDGTERLTPGRVTAAVAACTGLLATFIWLGPALDTYVFGALVVTSLTALVAAVGTSIGLAPSRWCVNRPAASLAFGIAAVVLFVWSTELGALRSGYAAATLAGGLSFAVLASQLPRR